MKHMVKFTALVCCSLAAASLFAVPETGWKQTGAGPYDYNDTANWVGGDIMPMCSDFLLSDLVMVYCIFFSSRNLSTSFRLFNLLVYNHL